MPHLTRDDGAKIYWEEAENNNAFSAVSASSAVKQPLLLIMGLGATLEWWWRLAPILASRYRTIDRKSVV